MRVKLLFLALALSAGLMAANTTTTQDARITSAVNVSANTDYVLTLTSNLFGSSGSINIPSDAMEHSVIIFQNIKPSVVISNWLSYVKINGSAAADGTNCQVKMYGKGTIILPYASNFSPLTCYTGTNYSGTACSNYSVGHSGGYMKTLTEANLLNNFKSFKLKRGYMVTFATGTAGWGYSRCFIADSEDLEMNLTAVLSGKVSSYRIFPWFDAEKKGIGDANDATMIDALNCSWCYRMWPDPQGYSMLPNTEYVPHKYKESWPYPADLGKADFACHLKANNEPANSSDEEPCDVAASLGNWQEMMRTGMRLCAPSSHDGGYAWQREFMNAIDARGWRCDILDIHCYWPWGNDANYSYSRLQALYNEYHRPIWISELMWGASWSGNGLWAAVSDPGSGSTANQQALYNGAKPIVDQLNTIGYVERYAWWNGENVASRIYNDGAVTTFGQYYASMDSKIGYNRSYEFVPVVVINKPYSLSSSISGNSISFSWKDKNGDMMDEIRVQYKTPSASTWTTLATVEPKDKTGSGDQSYSFSGTLENAESYWWRVANALENTEYGSDVLMPTPELIDNTNALPLNLGDFYFQFYSKEANSNLVWAVNASGEDRVLYKAYNSNYASDLYQLWSLETNSNGGYSLRNVGESDYLIASPNSWNFITRNDNYKVEAPQTAFDFTYYASGDYWICKNLYHNLYVGLWDNDKNFAVGEVLAGNRTYPTGTDSGDMLGIRLIPRSIVNEAMGIVTIPSGNYYLYNNESGLFLAAGNNWDTRAIMTETGLDFALSPSGDGYVLDSNVSNGNNAHYLGINGSGDYYCDSNPVVFTFAKAELIDGQQAYTIANGSDYLSAPTTVNTALTTTTDANAASAKWLLLTRADLMTKLDGASQDNPVNATFLLPCAGFGRNDGRINAWNGSPARGGFAGGEWGNLNAEKFNTNFDVYQLIEDAPDGVYEVTCQAFYRYGGHGISPAATAKANGTEVLNAKFYANDVIADVLSIFADAGNCGTVGVTSDYGYVPNSMDDASNYFQAGLYQNGPLRVTVEGGSLRIGIKKEIAVTNDWTIFDNFRLMYLGPALLPGDANNDGDVTFEDVTAMIRFILGIGNGQSAPFDSLAADMDGNGEVTLADLTALINLLLSTNE